MNYTFQVRGLTNGVIDYSRQSLAPVGQGSLYEPSLNESKGLAGVDAASGLGSASLLAQYATTKWYAPRGFFQEMVESTLDGAVSGYATQHCDGTPRNSEVMYKIEGATNVGGTTVAPIDWNNSGVATDTASVDVNFNGSPDSPFLGFNDWANVDLQQMSARRNLLAFSTGVGGTDLALGGGSELILGGGTDLSLGGGTDLASGGGNDLASGGGTDLSLGGGTDLSLGGGTDLSLGGGSEVDFNLANSTVDPPSTVKAVPVRSNSALITWNPPAFGQIRTYYVWRANTTTAPISRTNPPVNLAKITVTLPITAAQLYSFTDTTPKPKNTYIYFVTSVTGDKRTSGPSSFTDPISF
jgi:hypothetical protein